MVVTYTLPAASTAGVGLNQPRSPSGCELKRSCPGSALQASSCQTIENSRDASPACLATIFNAAASAALIPAAEVLVAPGKSIVVKVPPLLMNPCSSLAASK